MVTSYQIEAEEQYKQQLYEKYLKHLKKVCKDKDLREIATQFFADLDKRFNGQTFTKDNFETLNIYGHEVEQDIVKAVFADKEEASAIEIFLYLFQNNIKKISVVQPKKADGFSKNTSGIYSSISREIKIKEIISKELPSLNIQKPYNMSDREWKIELKKQKKEKKEKNKQFLESQKQKRLRSYKHTLYHELCHVFETETFNNRNFIKDDLSEFVMLNQNDEFKLRHPFKEINHKNLMLADSIINNGSSIDLLKLNLLEKGTVAISEIFNELLACQTGDFFRADKVDLKKAVRYTNRKFFNKEEMVSGCSYAFNYDMTELFKLALGNFDEKDLRFNPKKIVEKFNNLNVSNEALIKIKGQYTELFNNYIKTENLGVEQVSEKEFESANVFDTFNLIMGLMSVCKQDGKSEVVYGCKTLAQSVLLESIKNNIVDNLNNPEVVKDTKFYVELGKTLKTIDANILYPNDPYRFKKVDEKGNITFTKYSALDILPVCVFAEDYDEMLNIACFDEIVKAVVNSSFMEDVWNVDTSKLTDLVEFLEEQQNKIDNVNQLNKEHFAAVELQRVNDLTELDQIDLFENIED